MSRVLSHSWSDKKPFTRRCRWYCMSWADRDKDIRISFEDQTGKQHKFYGDDFDTAGLDWNAFKAGTLTTEIIRLQRSSIVPTVDQAAEDRRCEEFVERYHKSGYHVPDQPVLSSSEDTTEHGATCFCVECLPHAKDIGGEA